MARSCRWCLAGWCGLLTLAGCSIQPCLYQPPPRVEPSLAPDSLPECGRSKLTADQKGPAYPVAAAETLGRPQDFPPYHCLSALDCQCLAAAAWYRANLLDLEQVANSVQEAAALKIGTRGADRLAELRRTILWYRAQEDRNQAAGQALDHYYRLAEAEAGWDLLQQSLTQVDGALKKTRDLKAQGLALPVEEGTLYRQQVDLQGQSVQLQLTIDQINSQLRHRMAFSPCGPRWRFWPTDAFQIDTKPVCLDEAIAVGLKHRPELVLLNLLEEMLNSGDLATVQQLLITVDAMLGMAGPPPPCPKLMMLLARLFGDPTAPIQIDIRLQQLTQYHAHREREVIEEIRRAVLAIQAQMEVVTLARIRAESWQAKVLQAEERESKGVGSFADTTDARGEWLRARRRVVEEIVNLQRAHVQLRYAQGLLPEECCLPANLPAPTPIEKGSPRPPQRLPDAAEFPTQRQLILPASHSTGFPQENSGPATKPLQQPWGFPSRPASVKPRAIH